MLAAQELNESLREGWITPGVFPLWISDGPTTLRLMKVKGEKASSIPAPLRSAFRLDWRAGMGRLAILLVLFSVGCTKSMIRGDLNRIQPYSDQPRAGNVYLLRGFIGIWSYGIDGIGREINESGVRANVYRCEQWREVTAAILAKYKDQKASEPLVIVAHSWGADHALDMAHALEAAHISIDLIVTLDPVTPPKVPGNVKWCYNIYQTNGAWDKIPFFRGVALQAVNGSTGLLQNLNIRADRTDLLEPNTDHYNIEKNQKIHREVIAQVLKVGGRFGHSFIRRRQCLPRRLRERRWRARGLPPLRRGLPENEKRLRQLKETCRRGLSGAERLQV